MSLSRTLAQPSTTAHLAGSVECGPSGVSYAVSGTLCSASRIKDLLRLSLAIGERPEEEGAWQQEQRGVQELLQQFQTFRHQTVELISTLAEDEWEKPREEAYWNQPLTMQWIVTKAWQHMLEHTHDVLRLHLFWDAAAYLDAHPEEIH